MADRTETASVIKCLLLDDDRSAAVEKYRVAEGHFHRLLAAKGGRDVNGYDRLAAYRHGSERSDAGLGSWMGLGAGYRG